MIDEIVMVACRRIERSARGRRLGEQSAHWLHPDTVVAEARALLARGWTAKDIASQMEIPYPTVKWWFTGGRPTPSQISFVPV